MRGEGMSARTRYFERATMFVKEAWLRNIIDVRLVSTVDEAADIFTKATDGDTFASAQLQTADHPASICIWSASDDGSDPHAGARGSLKGQVCSDTHTTHAPSSRTSRTPPLCSRDR